MGWGGEGAALKARVKAAPPLGPPAAAIANAVADAAGARVRHLPLTAERVARALGLCAEGR